MSGSGSVFLVEQMQTEEKQAGRMGVSSHNIFGAVAMVNIQINDCYTRTIVPLGIESM